MNSTHASRTAVIRTDPATMPRLVTGAGTLVSGGFFVVSLPSFVADLPEIARDGYS